MNDRVGFDKKMDVGRAVNSEIIELAGQDRTLQGLEKV